MRGEVQASEGHVGRDQGFPVSDRPAAGLLSVGAAVADGAAQDHPAGDTGQAGAQGFDEGRKLGVKQDDRIARVGRNPFQVF